jgi:hypothetical protein
MTFLGLYSLVLVFFTVGANIYWWVTYDYWIFDVYHEYLNFTWVEYYNNLNIFFNLKSDLFSSSISFVMISGAMFVITFVVVELWDDKENSFFVSTLGYFISFMLLLLNSNDFFVFYLG